MSTYLITANQVVPIYPSGIDNPSMLYNPGTNVVYVDNNYTTSASGMPINPGASLPWDPGNPLFAFSPAGGSLNVTDGSGVLTDPAAIAAQILSQGLAAQIAASIKGNPPTVGVSGTPTVSVPAGVGVTGGSINNSQPQQSLGSISGNVTGSGNSVSVALPTGTQSLTLLNSKGPTATGPVNAKITVTGNTTGIVYYNQTIAGYDYAFCPVAPAVDPSVTISIVGSGGAIVAGATITLYAIARTDPVVSTLAGITPGYETGRYQPVISSTPPVSYAKVLGTTSATVEMLAGTTGQGIRIWALTLEGSNTSSTTAVNVQIYTDDSNGILLQAYGYGSVFANESFNGLVLPAGVGLELITTGVNNSFHAGVVYDIVTF